MNKSSWNTKLSYTTRRHKQNIGCVFLSLNLPTTKFKMTENDVFIVPEGQYKTDISLQRAVDKQFFSTDLSTRLVEGQQNLFIVVF